MVSAWAPTHATLIFSVPEKKESHVQMGSLGAGINFAEGVTTTLFSSSKDEVYYNNQQITGKTSLEVINIFRREILSEGKLKIHHKSQAPIGYGLSTSGSGAIGTSLALSKFFNQNLTFTQSLQIAHRAEIIQNTGLGSVSGLSVSGIELRKKIGAPGIGVVESFFSNLDIVILLFGPLSTSQVLLENEQMRHITAMGSNALSHLSVDFTFTKLFKRAREFAFTSSLATKRIKDILNTLKKIREPLSSMAMIGETIIVVTKNKERLLQWCRQNHINFISTKISTQLPHIVR